MTAALAHRPDLKTSTCRFCGTPLTRSFADLGLSPPANNFIRPANLNRPETFYPLHALICDACLLVQLEEFASPEQLFSDYAYFSSYADSWLHHAERYATAAIDRFALGPDSQVIEIASNDGYLLQFFARAGIPVLGIEPAANVARVAEEKGIPTLVRFFGRASAAKITEDHGKADLMIANNVLAHVPNINDFVAAMRMALAPSGTVTVEFPHLLRLMEQSQFDTIYHEHFSYLSMMTAERIFAAHGLSLYDAEELSTHGGSLRLYFGHAESDRVPSAAVTALRDAETAGGLDRIETYDGFMDQVARIKRGLLTFLIGARERGEQVVGYGAPAKGNTLLNYCGIDPDLLAYVVDNSPHKQGLYLPGTHIPVLAPSRIGQTRPDYVLILPWNIKDEIMSEAAAIRQWGGRFVVPVPELTILP